MIPRARKPFRPSLTALTIILASLLLAGVLGVLTWRNLDREERLMEDFLREEGLTLIHAIEAGARTSMMMNWQGDSLPTLMREIARENSVAYVVIVDESGKVLAASGGWPGRSGLSTRPLPDGAVVTRLTGDGDRRPVYEVAREFQPDRPGWADGSGMKGRSRQWCGMGCAPDADEGRRLIMVGLYTETFEAARGQDIRQSLLMGGLLLLLGSTGFYFLFLSQSRQVARTTLANMELYTRNVIESMPAGLITLDERGRIASLNSKAKEIFGKEDMQAEGKTLNDLVGSERCEIAPLIRGGGEFLERPMECRRLDGETVPVKVSASRLRDRKGEPLGTVLIVRDLREIRAMEEALERSRRLAALGRMAGGIAHEVRNPLGTLRGFAQFFARRNGEDATAREYADLMVGEVDRLNRTVSALLQFARPREPELSSVDLAELLRRTARLVEDDAAANGVAFRLDPPTEPVVTAADPDLLVQALLNLLQNALAATEAGGEVLLDGTADGENIRLRVQDTGKGMSAEERAHMFDPFFTTRKEGTGLGLAVVQQIVEQHRGRIEVESSPGQGTRIELLFPVAGEPGSGENPESAPPKGRLDPLCP